MRVFAGDEFAEALECVRMAGGASSGESRLRDADEEFDELQVHLRGIICIGGLIAGEG